MKLTKFFGPTISMLILMSADLAEFMVFWIILMLSFVCVTALLYDPWNHMTFLEWTYYYYGAALGDFSNSNYITEDIGGDFKWDMFRFG